MRNPHVDWLVYRLEWPSTTTFQNPPPVECDTAAFHVVLHDGQVRFDFKEHHTTVESAHSSVAPFLRAWEISAGLTYGANKVHFVYENAGLTERDQRLGDPTEISAHLSAKFGLSASATVVRASYPEPPKAFVVSPTVETLWTRYEGYLSGREPLSSMAYFRLTVIENSVGRQSGKRKAAAARYSIHVEVLKKLGEITASRGSPATARKMDDSLAPQTPAEVGWIEATVKAIIIRVAEIEAGAAVQPIEMSRLPSL